MTAPLTSKLEGDGCLYAWLGTAPFLDFQGGAARPVIRRASARVGEGWSVLGAAVAPRPSHFRFIRGGVRRLVYPASLSRRWGPCRGWLLGRYSVTYAPLRSPQGPLLVASALVDVKAQNRLIRLLGACCCGGLVLATLSKTIFQSDFGSSQPKL